MSSRTENLVLIATKTTRPNEIEAWIEALVPLVAEAHGTVWELVDAPPPGGPGPGHSHVIRFDSVEGLADYADLLLSARGGARLPPGHAEIRRDIWTRHGGPLGGPASPTALIAAEVLCTDPERHAEWDEWYDRQHLPDMMASGAFQTGSRWHRTPPRPGGANDLTLYEIGGQSIQDAIARSAAVMPDLVSAGRKHECHTGGLTMALSLIE